jgi:hypothetical protein
MLHRTACLSTILTQFFQVFALKVGPSGYGESPSNPAKSAEFVLGQKMRANEFFGFGTGTYSYAALRRNTLYLIT